MLLMSKIMKMLRCQKSVELMNNLRTYSDSQNPFTKTWKIISQDMPSIFGMDRKPIVYPTHADIVIVGGGFIGSSVAYWLKTRAGEGLSVVVLEKDPSYKRARQNVTLGTITQHFSLPENMHLSMYAAEFLRAAKNNLQADIDIQYCPYGHLVLASEKYAQKLEETVLIQKEHGVRNELLTVEDIRMKYPWINTEDIQLGCIGIESEGTFNAWALLQGLINKSQDLGAMYLNAEVVGFELEQQRDVLMEGIPAGSFRRINRVIYRTPDNEEYAIKFAACILSAGHESGEVAKLARVGTEDGLLQASLPVLGREQKVYSIENSAQTTGLNTPMITDTSGLWLRRNGFDDNLLCGHVPLLTSDIKESNGSTFLDNIVLPSLVNRIPKCKDSQIKDYASETLDYNTFDETGILGPHPYHNNLYIATGFGKLACTHGPGIGRAIAELIIDSHFTTIDLSRFSFDRILTGQPMIEFNIY